MKNIPLPDLYYLENPDLKQLFRIMRISIFLLFFCLFSLMAENSHSQNARVTINTVSYTHLTLPTILLV